MRSFHVSVRTRTLLTVVIGSVWIFHGLYSKVLDGIPRHRLIVARVLGEDHARGATVTVGVCEVLVGCWAFSRWNRPACAAVQTLAIAVMNTLEIVYANDLLVWAAGMVVLNLGFLCLVWFWALASPRTSST
jgi:hypothetical protein